ncbi:aromatic ring-opening dioxygenase LigA [Granulicoccus sp. GXG6511]|uniref:aromatic ring-opening dioxygenase LigA n=1 Tax=Granulicoccus sp. GXG6511 TaxID=3381351 RepID=UPI003D7D2BD3
MANTLARTACYLGAPALIAAGAGGWAMISKQLASQKIEVHPDSPILAGKTVAGPITAFAQANVIEQHAQGIGGGRTFAEISHEWMEAQESGDNARAEELAGAREMVMQANLLRASLFTSVLAFGVAALAGGMGVLTALVGSALPKGD